MAFVSDPHGGEYYRPLPMLVWWLLGRPGGGSAPFAALALGAARGRGGLAAACCARSAGRPPSPSGRRALMLLAPQNLDAAYWFSASTDLFATVFVLASLVAAVRGRLGLAAVAALAAYLSKESAFVLPLLALLVLRRTAVAAPRCRRGGCSSRRSRSCGGARARVLHGWGGAGDARAGLAAKSFCRCAAGLAHVFTGEGVLPEPLAFGAGNGDRR